MIEELKKEAGEGTPDEKKAPEPSAIELRAIEMGWRPKEEWDGDPDEFVDAKEYVGRKPLFDKIQSQSRSLKETNRALEALKTHYTKVKEDEYQRALKTLKEERASAVEEGDRVAFNRLDDEIKGIEKSAAEIAAIRATPLVQEQPVEHPAFMAWKNRNQWYTTTEYMKSYADQVGARLAATGMVPEDVLKEVEKAVRKEFPQKFTNPNKASAPDVDSSRGNTGKSTKDAEVELTPQERRIMETLIKSDPVTFTKEKYMAQLKAIKERK
jgi:DNA-binding ferritin-like protein